MTRAEPPLAADAARATAAPAPSPSPASRAASPRAPATSGLCCNVTLVGRQGTSGGFRTWRYVDTQGRECAFYDTALLFPLNALKLDGSSTGVAVLDMSDPAHPVQTDRLTELPMLSPHESFNLNAKRGLLAAVLGNPATYPGLVSIYDAQRGLPPSRAAVDAPGRALRPRERLLARTARRSTRRAPRCRRSPRSTSPTPRRRTPSGTATSSRTACRSAPTATAPTSPTRPAARC